MQICLLDSAGTASSRTAARAAAEVGAASGRGGELNSEAGEATAGGETADVDRDLGSGSATLAPMQVGSVGPADRRTRYEHLAPLHGELAALPEGHADRERLRAVLIACYLPVARNIARRYGYRGEDADDLEQVASMGLVLAVDRFEPERVRLPVLRGAHHHR